MAKKKDEEEKKELTWMDLDEATLKGDSVKSLAALRESWKVAKTHRTAFQEAVIKAAKLAEGKTIRFSYNYGKVRVAVDDEDPKKKEKTAKFKL